MIVRRATRVLGRGERGSVTAEFAASLPAVVLVLAVALGAVQAVGVQVRLQDAAADAARTVARGDDASLAAERVEAALPGAHLVVGDDGELVCAVVTRDTALAGLAPVTLSARSCALAGGA